MSWHLNGTDQYARFAMSAALQAATGGPFTFGAVVNLDATTDGALINFLDGTSARHFLEIFGTYNFGTAAAAKAGPAGVGGGTTWVHIIMSKATGNVAVEYTIFDLTAATAPTSGTASGGNLGNGAAPGASGQIQVGRFGTSATEYVAGKVAALWGHATYMNQATREALTTWALSVAAASASGLGWAVRLNSLSTITDATLQGGDETGRFGTTPFTLAADPSGVFFASGSTVNAALSATLASPTGTAIATPRHPAQLAATLASPVGTIVARPRHPAALSATLAPPVGTLIAKPRHPAVLAATLPSPGASAAALPRVRAQLAATLAAPAATMLATPSTPTGTVFAALSAVLAPPAGSLAAKVRHGAFLVALLPSPAGAIVKDQTPYVTATLTAGAAAPATLTTGTAATATLTAATL